MDLFQMNTHEKDKYEYINQYNLNKIYKFMNIHVSLLPWRKRNGKARKQY